MTAKDFNELVDRQLGRIKAVLCKKEGEYNLEEDRLGFFKRAAALAQETPEQALYGFMLKHLVSLSDMVQSGKAYSEALFEEKITDIENYLLLLLGLLKDGGRMIESEVKEAGRKSK